MELENSRGKLRAEGASCVGLVVVIMVVARPSALRLEARLVGPNEGANVVGHVEQRGPLLLAEGHREAAETDRPLFSLTLSDTPRLAVRLSCVCSARRRSSSVVTSSSGLR